MTLPSTSSDAWRRTQPYAATERRRVRVAINEAMNAGRYGATTDEVEVATGMLHQSCSARMNELAAEGVVETFGLRRRTRTGSMAEVYRLAAVGHDPAAPVQREMAL